MKQFKFTSKKDLKKHIDRMAQELAEVIIPAAVHAQVISIDKAVDALNQINRLEAAADEKISVHFGKKTKDFASVAEYKKAKGAFLKQQYAEANSAFRKGVEEIIDSLDLSEK